MPDINIMVWNIQTFGATKYSPANGGGDLLDMIAAVADHNDVAIIGLLEVCSNLGAAIGNDIATRMENLSTSMVPDWRWQTTPQFSSKNEQYLFVWDNKVVNLGNAPNSFQYQFVNAAPPPANLGFPRSSVLDRPPYLAYFVGDPTGNQRDIRIAIMHSPEPGYSPGPRDAARRLALVAEFLGGDMCVIMGDMNVRWSADQTVANSFGADAFTNLVNAGFTQLLPQALTSLKKYGQAFVGMNIHDCYSEPYDQIFFRNAPNPNGITYSNEGFEELIVECQNGHYLTASLAAIDVARNGMAGNYATVEDSFAAFSHYVSDHMPILVTLTV